MSKCFSSELEKKHALIDKSLYSYFRRKDKYYSDLYKCMKYPLEAGGKRLRPAIMLFLWDIMKGKGSIMPAACAVEMVHTYSLIHDDLPSMDNDDFRRGKPTLHKLYDEATAILAGDALFSYALEVFLMTEAAPARLNRAMSFFLNSIGPEGMVLGQFIDTKIENYPRSKGTLDFIHKNKTGALIAASFTIPAILAGVKNTDKFTELGFSAGLLFQIVDDILDVKSDSKTLGKTTGKDVSQNKLTYITMHGYEKAVKNAEKEMQKAHALADSMHYDMEIIHSMIDYFYKRVN